MGFIISLVSGILGTLAGLIFLTLELFVFSLIRTGTFNVEGVWGPLAYITIYACIAFIPYFTICALVYTVVSAKSKGLLSVRGYIISSLSVLVIPLTYAALVLNLGNSQASMEGMDLAMVWGILLSVISGAFVSLALPRWYGK